MTVSAERWEQAFAAVEAAAERGEKGAEHQLELMLRAEVEDRRSIIDVLAAKRFVDTTGRQ